MVNAYKVQYFTDILVLSKKLSYANFELFYTYLRPIDTDYAYQISRYDLVLTQLKKDEEMSAHVVNISKIVDDLTLKLVNTAFNTDSNLTLTKIRAIDRFSHIQEGSISYISHIAFVSLEESSNYTGLTEITFELTSIPKLLPLDFVSESISDLIVNGYNVAPLIYG